MKPHHFCGSFNPAIYLAVQLLQKLSISAVGKREKLMRMIKNPVTQYLPVNSRKVGEYIVLYKHSCHIYYE